jgi:hypothetical protein
MVEGRIKCVAVVTHETNTLANVVEYMQNTLDSLATARVQSKLRSDFQNDLVIDRAMKVWSITPGKYRLYPKITYSGSLKPNREEAAVMNATVQDLAVWWQADLINRGYTIVKWYVKQY